MRITPNPGMILRFRFVHLIALSSVIALSACQDVTAPESEVAALDGLRLAQSSATDELSSLGSSLDDMTGWSLAALADNNQRGNIVGVLNGLKGHLNSGKISLIQEDLTQARAIIASLTDVQQAEVGPVSVALDVVQRALDGASQ